MITVRTKELVKQIEFNDSIDGNFTSFIKFVEDVIGIKLKLYQKAYMRLTWKPRQKHYIVGLDNVKNKNTIEFENGSKLTIVPKCRRSCQK